MPHLAIQYSAALDADHDMDALCERLNAAMREAGIFPLGGIRVRAWPVAHESVADGHPRNAFADLVLRIGTGRTEGEKRAAGERIMAEARRFFAARLAEPHFALALEIREIEMSWKANSIHPRLDPPK